MAPQCKTGRSKNQHSKRQITLKCFSITNRALGLISECVFRYTDIFLHVLCL